MFKELLSANSDLSSGRYFRLMALAGLEILATIPLASWGIYVDLTATVVKPYKGFADTHFNFSHVNQIPAIIWMNQPILTLGLLTTRWSIVICGFLFFLFFGFADEARRNYRLAFHSVVKRVGLSTGSMTASSGGATSSNPSKREMAFKEMSLPSFVQKPGDGALGSTTSLEKRDSRTSFADPLSGHVTIADIVSLKKEDAVISSSDSSSSTASLPPDPNDEYVPIPAPVVVPPPAPLPVTHDSEDVVSFPPAPRAPRNEHVPRTLTPEPEPEPEPKPEPEHKAESDQPDASPSRTTSFDAASPPQHVADAPTPVEPSGPDEIV